MFTKNELELAYGSIDNCINDIDLIIKNENHRLNTQQIGLLMTSHPKLERLKNKLGTYISMFDIHREVKEGFVFKVSFFCRDGSGHISTTLSKPRWMECTRQNLMKELDLEKSTKSGMIMFEYFISENEFNKFMNQEDVEPSIDCIFTEPV